MTVAGPEGGIEGTYTVEAGAVDDSGDPIRYRFRAESVAGELVEVGPQGQNVAPLRLAAGTWTLRVTVDDVASCDDEAPDAVCMTEIDVLPRPPAEGGLELHLAFDDELEPGRDSSTTGRDGMVDGAIWVDDDERGGVLEFTGGDDGFVRVDALEVPGAGFTIAMWAYRDALTATGGNDGLFQFQLGGATPSTNGADKIIGSWVGSGSDPWGRVHQADGTQLDLPRSLGLLEFDTWTHLVYRADGDALEVFIDAEPVQDLSLFYDATIGAHDTLFVGKQGGESWGGRLDDFVVYSRSLDLDEIETLFVEGPSGPGDVEPAFLRGDADASGALEVTDAVNILAFLFLGTFQPMCADALDWDDNGVIEIADSLGSLSAQFLGGAPAPAPGSDTCGVDATADALDCGAFPICEGP
jgi:hypothetical protein